MSYSITDSSHVLMRVVDYGRQQPRYPCAGSKSEVRDAYYEGRRCVLNRMLHVWIVLIL